MNGDIWINTWSCFSDRYYSLSVWWVLLMWVYIDKKRAEQLWLKAHTQHSLLRSFIFSVLFLIQYLSYKWKVSIQLRNNAAEMNVYALVIIFSNKKNYACINFKLYKLKALSICCQGRTILGPISPWYNTPVVIHSSLPVIRLPYKYNQVCQ